jgi:hypothetical protein
MMIESKRVSFFVYSVAKVLEWDAGQMYQIYILFNEFHRVEQAFMFILITIFSNYFSSISSSYTF